MGHAAKTSAETPTDRERGRGVGNSSKAAKPEPENLESFVALAYSRRGRRVAMKKKVAVAIAQSPPPDDTLWQRLQELARADPTFAVPRQMLLAALPHKSTTKAWSRVLDACVCAFRAHPATKDLVPGLMDGPPETDTLVQLLEQAGSLNPEQSTASGSGKPLPAGPRAMLRANVTGTVALWMVAARGMHSQTALRALHDAVWTRESRQITSVVNTWRRLLDTRDPAALGLVGDAFVASAEQAGRDAVTAAESAALASRRAESLEAEVAKLRAQLDQEQQTSAGLRAAASQAAQDHEAALSHARDTQERLRSRVLRRITREVELLDQGILALKREPPKLHVMVDHGERALGGLRDEIKALQAEVRP